MAKCGVPQGSALGPALWIRCGFASVADDTLVLVRGEDARETARRTETAFETVRTEIEGLGLRVSAEKTKATAVAFRK